MNIQYYVKNVYGKESEYVADVQLAATIRVLTKKITIDIADRMALEELGHTFERVFEPTAELTPAEQGMLAEMEEV